MCNTKLCNIFAVILSILIGVGVAALWFFGIITGFTLGTTIALILGTTLLLALIAVAVFAIVTKTSPLLRCLCEVGIFLAFALISSLIVSISILTIGLGISLLLGLFLAFLGGLFFSLSLALLFVFLSCVISKVCCHC